MIKNGEITPFYYKKCGERPYDKKRGKRPYV